MSSEELVWSKVDKDGPIPEYATELGVCWIWRGYINSRGYGAFSSRPAYRVTYEYVYGAVPAGLQLDHLCRVRACVRPSHMEPVTIKENVRRSIRGSLLKKHCSNGHEYSDENTRVYKGERNCRTCEAAASRRYKARIKERSESR